jgi:hypothetical protein
MLCNLVGWCWSLEDTPTELSVYIFLQLESGYNQGFMTGSSVGEEKNAALGTRMRVATRKGGSSRIQAPSTLFNKQYRFQLVTCSMNRTMVYHRSEQAPHMVNRNHATVLFGVV